jgi:hypothetical protein
MYPSIRLQRRSLYQQSFLNIKLRPSMAQVNFPTSYSQQRESMGKFFNRLQQDGKSSLVYNIPQHDYVELSEKQYPEWVLLDKEIMELENLLRIKRGQKDRLWKNYLRTALLAAKKVISSYNAISPELNDDYGFSTTINPSKKLTKAQSLEMDAKRLATKLNAQAEANAMAQRKDAALSVTINEVTKSNRVMG